MSDIERFIGDLRQELGRLSARPPRGELLRRSREIPLLWPEDEFPQERPWDVQFSSALARCGGKAYPVESESKVVSKVGEIVEKSGAKKVTRWFCPRLEPFELEEGLAHLDVEWVNPSAGDFAGCNDYSKRRKIRSRLEQIDVGITDADYAVAHTGTLIFMHGPERYGITNPFPWTHIAIVRLSQMVRTIEDLFVTLANESPLKDGPPNIVFVTGPSRSGDIDLAVGQGATGPGELHVILVK